MRPDRALLAVFGAAAAFFLVPIFFRDLWTPDEPRYALVAQQMMWSGDYLVPHRNVEVYKEKPPLLFWSIAAASLPVGYVTEPTARIPSVLAGAITLALTFALARRMYNTAIAWLSVIVLATAFRFWWQAQNGQIDMLLCACTTLAFYALYRWNESRHTRWLVVLYAGIAFGLLAKGPPALLIPLLAAVVYYRREPRSLAALKPGWGIPAAIGLFLLWFIPARLAIESGDAQAGAGFAAEFQRQIVDRMVAGGGHVRPPWYYIVSLPVEWFPWSLFAPWVVVHAWRHRRDDPQRFLNCWIVPAFVFFSAISTKRHVYLVPLSPAIAMLIASSLQRALAAVSTRRFVPVPILWALIVGGLGLAVTAIPFSPAADLSSPRLVPLAIVCLGLAAWTISLLRRAHWPRFPYQLAAQMALLLLTVAVCAFPVADRVKSSRPFLRPVRQLARAGKTTVYSAAFVREEYVFYARMLHEPLLVEPGRTALPPASADLARRFPGYFAKALEDRAPDSLDAAEIRKICTDTALELGLPPDCVDAWLAAVHAEAAAAEQAFASNAPAVLLVSTEHWPWVRAFFARPEALILLKREQVTSREMLMFGNRAAVAALTTPEPAPVHARNGILFPQPLHSGA